MYNIGSDYEILTCRKHKPGFLYLLVARGKHRLSIILKAKNTNKIKHHAGKHYIKLTPFNNEDGSAKIIMKCGACKTTKNGTMNQKKNNMNFRIIVCNISTLSSSNSIYASD